MPGPLPSEWEGHFIGIRNQDAEELLERFRGVGDLWCSALFQNNPLFEEDDRGKDRSGDRYARAAEALQASVSEWNNLEDEPWMKTARRFAAEHGFFHWEVEFSEVFYDEHGTKRERPGFDAIIGNPPYVRMEAFKGLKDFLRHVYETHATRTDLYVYFMERSVALLRVGGEYGVIVSNKFLRANYGKGVRALLADRVGVREVVDFGELPVFEDASTMPALFFGRRGLSVSEPRYAQVTTLDFPDLVREVNRQAYSFEPEGLDGEDWQLVPRNVAAIMKKMEECGDPLGELVDGEICWGIKTGRNEAFFVDQETRDRLIEEDPRSEEVIKPLVVGNEIRRYRIERDEKWLLYMPHGIDIDRYPAVEEHLAGYRNELDGRATDQAWYELQQPQEAYREFFDGPKILYPEISREARFAYDSGQLYPNNKCFFIPGTEQYLVALLNSRLVYFYLAQVCSTLGNPAEKGRLEFRAQYMEGLPIRWPSTFSNEAASPDLTDWLQALYECGLWRLGLIDERPQSNALEAISDAVADATGIKPVRPDTSDDKQAADGRQGFGDLLTQVDHWLSENAIAGEVAVEQLLARLSRTMAKLHKRRLEEVGSFLGWLEEQLECAVDDLSGKTYVQAYWEQPEGVDKLLGTIEKNRPSTTDLDVRKPKDYGQTNSARERIISGFERSMDTLDPILRQMSLTDELIDQIVYRLYGLTDGEVAVVEEYAGGM